MFTRLTVPVYESLMKTVTALGVSPSTLAESVNQALIGCALQTLGETPEDQQLHALLEELSGELHQLFENEAVELAHVETQRPLL